MKRALVEMCIPEFVKKAYFLVVVIAFLGCSRSTQEYEADVKQWHQSRINYLKSEEGFINLAGLFWLKEGANTFGADSTNDINFTSKSLPNMGVFQLQDSLVYLIANSEILIEGEPVSDTTLIFENGITKKMEFKSLSWFVVKRGKSIGIRLRDFNSPFLENFDSIDYYITDHTWKVEAVWKVYKNQREVPFTNVLGMKINYPVKGAFYFTIAGSEYTLEPLGEPDEYGYFVMFYDKTSGHSTYGSGRYLYVEEPDATGKTYVDFNKAFNPPCAFTEFATCLFPHKENRLPIFIKAGEKFSSH